MRIDSTQVDHFGALEDRIFSDLGAGLNVFTGPNEAGKSTLFTFLVRMLYGFPSPRQVNLPRYGQEEAGENFGGTLVLEDDAGERLIVERRPAAPARRRLRARTQGGRSLGEAELAARLGVSREVFTSVFAVDLSRLEDLSREESLEEIFSAGLVVARSPARVEDDLAEAAARLFRPRGRTQPLVRLRKELEELSRELEELEDRDQEYGERLRDASRHRRELAQVDQEFAAALDERNRLRLLIELHEPWCELTEARRELSTRGEAASFSPALRGRLEGAEQQARAARRRIAEAHVALERPRQAMEERSPSAEVLAAAARIQGLVASTEGHRRAIEERVRLGEDGRRREERLGEVLDLFIWDREGLRKAETGGDVAARLECFQEELEAARGRMARAEERHARVREELQRERSGVETLEVQLAGFWSGSMAAADLRAHLAGLRRLDRLGRQRRDGERDLAVAEERARALDAERERIEIGCEREWGSLPWIVDLVVLAGGAALFVGSSRWVSTSAGLRGVVVLLVLGVWAAFRSLQRGSAARRARLEDQVARRRDELDEAQREAATTRRSLEELGREEGGARAQLGPAGAALTEQALPGETERAADALDLASRLAEARERREALEKAMIQADETCAEADEQLADREADFHRFLAGMGLPEEGSPLRAIELLARVREGRRYLRAEDRAAEEVACLDAQVAAFEAEAAELTATLGLPAVGDSIAAAELCRLALAEARELERCQEGLVREVAEVESRLELEERELVEATRVIEETLAAAGVEDRDGFERVAAEAEEARRLADRAEERERFLRRNLGERLESFREEIEGSSRAKLEAQRAEVGRRIEALEEHRAGLHEALGEVTGELKRLEVDEERTELMAEREHLRARLQEEAARWAVLTLARTLSREVRRKHERERQPAVILEAEQVFARLTEGRYPTLRFDPYDRRLTVLDQEGRARAPEELSRGAMEQLYLAHRIGVVGDLFRTRKVRLPVLFDDVAVNFDARRVRALARSLRDLAETHQVLYFTCHPWVEEALREEGGEVRVHPVKPDGGSRRTFPRS